MTFEAIRMGSTPIIINDNNYYIMFNYIYIYTTNKNQQPHTNNTNNYFYCPNDSINVLYNIIIMICIPDFSNLCRRYTCNICLLHCIFTQPTKDKKQKNSKKNNIIHSYNPCNNYNDRKHYHNNTIKITPINNNIHYPQYIHTNYNYTSLINHYSNCSKIMF